MPNQSRPDDPPEPVTIKTPAVETGVISCYDVPCEKCGHRLGHHTIYFDGNDSCFGQPGCKCKGFVGHGIPPTDDRRPGKDHPGGLPGPYEADPGWGL